MYRSVPDTIRSSTVNECMFNDEEIEYLRSQPMMRLGTVRSDGQVDVMDLVGFELTRFGLKVRSPSFGSFGMSGPRP